MGACREKAMTPSCRLGLIMVLAATLSVAGKQQSVMAAQVEWLDGYNRRDERTLVRIEADDFCVVFGDGRVQSKADQVVNIRKALSVGATYRIALETTEVRLYGKTAVLTGIVVEKGTFPNEQGVNQPFSQRSRYTDTWILQKGKWRVVSSHLSDLK